ncbi:hypothetical protein ACSQJH_004399, partial [Klebsiella michiganensis]
STVSIIDRVQNGIRRRGKIMHLTGRHEQDLWNCDRRPAHLIISAILPDALALPEWLPRAAASYAADKSTQRTQYVTGNSA